MIVTRDIVPMVPRWKCERPGCGSDATVNLRSGPIGSSVFLCDACDEARFADPPSPAPVRLVRQPTPASIAVGGTLLSIGVAEAAVALVAVAWSRATDVLAPSWAASFWSNGVLIAAIGLVALVVLMVIERCIEARPQ